MKKLIFLLLFIFSCEEPAIDGCTTTTACNYNADATKDDGSCGFAEDNYDCDLNCITHVDCLDVCGGSCGFRKLYPWLNLRLNL